MSAREWEESHEETSTEEERRFEEALRQLGADTPVSPDFCARVLAAAQLVPPTSAAVESTAVSQAGRPRRRFQLPSRLSPVISVLAAGLVLSLAMNVWWGFRVQDMATLRQELATAQAQVRTVQAELQQLQARLVESTHQLTVLQQQAQREKQLAEKPQQAHKPARTTSGFSFSREDVTRDRVRAKVGIGLQVRPGEPLARAKSTEKLKTGDFLRVYVVPEDDAYVYVVHNDGKNLTLLNAQNATTRVPGGMPVTLPAPEKFYQIDGGSDRESITVICSPTELREVASLVSTPNVSQHNWLALEKALLDQSKIDLAQPTDKPFQIAGNVRSMSGNDPFLNTLVIYSGTSLVVKKYDFQVQK